MRYIFGFIALLVIYTGCSTTESIQEDTSEQKPVVVDTDAAPQWYSAGVHSSSDSLALHGYSLASATDSLQAANLSTEAAIEYLRFEIDRNLEEIRENFADSEGESSAYHSSAFIIRLRKKVSSLPLDSANLTYQHRSGGDNIHYSYAKATISRSELNDLLKRHLEDERFLRHISQIFM